jgi:multisubunit Na+/H+ antiporter MnhB subunit
VAGLETLFDVAVAALLVVLALESLYTPNLFTSIAFFIAFGLVMALAWVRLQAPDLALAEAAVGAGLTGVLLLDAAREISASRGGERAPRPTLRATSLVAAAAVGLALVAALLELPAHAPGLAPAVRAALPLTAVEHAVTAVLLDFRALDTWLETAVLLLAVITVLMLQAHQHVRLIPRELAASPVLSGLVGLFAPIVLVFSGYLLWVGTHAPGGAFQAGVLLGAGGILLELAGVRTVSRLRWPALRGLLTLGVAGFLLLSGALLLMGRGLLALPDAGYRAIVIALEVAIAISVALTVVSLVVGSNLRLEPQDQER